MEVCFIVECKKCTKKKYQNSAKIIKRLKNQKIGKIKKKDLQIKKHNDIINFAASRANLCMQILVEE